MTDGNETADPPLELTDDERELLDGGGGEAAQLAMRMVVALARMVGPGRLLSVTQAHIDSCLYHGRARLDFARLLADAGGEVRVPTTLNVSSLDLRHPEQVRLPEDDRDEARALMDAYVTMGCRATWTCAPYQLASRPEQGEHIAWAESNAIVFANSVLGARTERYGDFIDICAALTGRVPDAGLHRDEARRGRVVTDTCTYTAPVLVLDEPLSFWGGFDPHDGRVIDRNHPQHGEVLTGRVVVMAASRGSSSSSSVLAEAIRLGTAPAAIVLGEPDAIVALGALAAAELYGRRVPIVAMSAWRELHDEDLVTVAAGGPGDRATVTAA